MAEKLASRKNQWVQKFLDGRKGKGSWDQRLFPEGVRLCEEVTRAGLKVEACYFSQRFGEAEARRFGTKETLYFVLDDELFQQVSETRSPQGILLVCERPKTLAFEDLEAKIRASEKGISLLVLEQVQDPGNVGTILRTAYALGFDAAILTGETASPWQGKVLRAAMGAVFHLPLLMESDGSKIIRFSKEHGVKIVAAALDGKPVKAYKRDRNVGLWIGNEGRGLSEAALAEADVKLTIPMPGGAESLNASIAAAIMMYQLQM